MSIHSKISDLIRKRIESGEYPPGGTIDSVRTLASQFSASPEVIRLALDLLRKEGLIISRHGKGNYVAENPVSTREVLVLAPLEGHINRDIVTEFIARFSKHPECRLLLEDVTLDDGNLDPAYVERRSNELRQLIDERMLNGKLDAVFFNGSSRVSLSFLKEYLNRLKLFCFSDISQLVEVPCPSVSIDYYHGYYIALHHLFDIGCREIMVIGYPVNASGIYSFHGELLETTAREECEAAGIRLHYCVNDKEEAIRTLKKNPGIDGIFSHADNRLCQLFKALPQLGRDPGRDLALVGFFHTPWAEYFSPTLTSVDIRLESIVDQVIQMYFSKGELKTFVKKIRPKLVLGESTLNFRPKKKRKN